MIVVLPAGDSCRIGSQHAGEQVSKFVCMSLGMTGYKCATLSRQLSTRVRAAKPR